MHFLEQAFPGADFSTEKFSAALSLISAALFQCPKVAKFSVAHFLNFRAISVALFQLPKVVKFSVAHLKGFKIELPRILAIELHGSMVQKSCTEYWMR